jgi:hypothetical protein
MDIQDMTDEAYSLYRERQWAVSRYRSEGYNDFADRVELGLEDECSQMRLAHFFLAAPLPHSQAFIVAWNDISSATATAVG